MKLVTEITIKLVEEVDEKAQSIIRQTLENGDLMEESRIAVIEEVVGLLSLTHDEKEVHVSFDIQEDDEE